MESDAPKNTFYDLILPRVELLAALAAVLGLVLRLGYGRSSPALLIGLLTLATAFFVRAFLPPPVPAAAAPTPAYVPVTPPPPPAGYLALVADKIQGIASATALVGVLFRLLLWPGAALMLTVGTLTLLPVVAYQAATRQLTWRPALALALGLAAWLTPFPEQVRYIYRDDPALAEKLLYQQAHPRDTAAHTEVQRLLRARRQRQ